jgi:hypothetical protein
MSCSTCTKSGGCETNKGPQRLLLDETMAKIYPTRTWGQPDDEARFMAGVRRAEVMRLQKALAVATKAPTFFRAGADDDLADFVYVLCLGREPALVDVRDGLADVPDEAPIRERYLRVAFSSVVRAATVQEVAMELDVENGARVIKELPQPGVYDAKILKRMRSVVDLVEASDIEHIDFGLVDKPVANAEFASYVERYGVEPTLANFLFFAQPARTASLSYVEDVSAYAAAAL